jgi:hypothetical protein
VAWVGGEQAVEQRVDTVAGRWLDPNTPWHEPGWGGRPRRSSDVALIQDSWPDVRLRRWAVARLLGIAVVNDERVIFHHVDLQRDAVRPRTAELSNRDSPGDEYRAACAGACLSKHLRRQHAQREPDLHRLGRQAVCRRTTAVNDRVEPDLLGVSDTGAEVWEHTACVEVGHVDVVPGRLHARCKRTAPLSIMDQREARAPDPGQRAGEERDLLAEHVRWAMSTWPQLDPEVEGIASRVDKAQRYLQSPFRASIGPAGLTKDEWNVLMALRRHVRSHGWLCRDLAVSTGAMTHRLDRLEQRGLVKRATDPQRPPRRAAQTHHGRPSPPRRLR